MKCQNLLPKICLGVTFVLLTQFFFIVNINAAELPMLKWVLQTTETSLKGPYIEEWVKFSQEVKSRTNGKFNIHVALAKELGIDRSEFPQAVSMGTIELSFWLASEGEGILPYVGIFNMPYLTTDQASCLKVEKVIREKLDEDFKKLGYKILSPNAFFVWPPQDLLSREPIADLTDLRGIKVRVWRDLDRKLISNLGGEPVYMPITEVYTAMQRGVVGALNTGPQAMVNSSMWEIGKYYYAVLLEPSGAWIIINSNEWRDLPQEYKTILEEECENAIHRLHDKWHNVAKEQRDILKNNGVKIKFPDEKERNGWADAAMPIWNEWANKNKLNKEVLDLTLKTLNIVK